MQAVWCAAKVMAWASWATNSTQSNSGEPAVSPMRNTISTAASSSHPVRDRRGSQRPWVKNQPISMMTDTAHSRPMVVLL